MTSVTQRMTASREARKHRGGHVQRTFSPLTPIIQRLYSGKTDEVCVHMASSQGPVPSFSPGDEAIYILVCM